MWNSWNFEELLFIHPGTGLLLIPSDVKEMGRWPRALGAGVNPAVGSGCRVLSCHLLVPRGHLSQGLVSHRWHQPGVCPLPGSLPDGLTLVGGLR